MRSQEPVKELTLPVGPKDGITLSSIQIMPSVGLPTGWGRRESPETGKRCVPGHAAAATINGLRIHGLRSAHEIPPVNSLVAFLVSHLSVLNYADLPRQCLVSAKPYIPQRGKNSDVGKT